MAVHRPGVGAGVGGDAAGVGAVDEAVVLPSGTPRVGDNPGAYLVLVLLAIDTVAVKVKLNAVVIAHNGLGVVVRWAPVGHIDFAHHAERLVGRRFGYVAGDIVGGGHAKPADTAGVEVVVALMVPEPVLDNLTAFLGHGVLVDVGVGPVAVVGGAVPLVVALHPAVVGVLAVLAAEVF